jgi:hypothetical protein
LHEQRLWRSDGCSQLGLHRTFTSMFVSVTLLPRSAVQPVAGLLGLTTSVWIVTLAIDVLSCVAKGRLNLSLIVALRMVTPPCGQRWCARRVLCVVADGGAPPDLHRPPQIRMYILMLSGRVYVGAWVGVRTRAFEFHDTQMRHEKQLPRLHEAHAQATQSFAHTPQPHMGRHPHLRSVLDGRTRKLDWTPTPWQRCFTCVSAALTPLLL